MGILIFEGLLNTIILWVLWSLVFLGFLMNMVWLNAPKWVRSVLYVAAGWLGTAAFPQLLSGGVVTGFWLFLGGGAVYTIGAIFYALKRPNPIPGVLGYHELFHIAVLLGAALHYIAIVTQVLASPA